MAELGEVALGDPIEIGVELEAQRSAFQGSQTREP
jgi:hypothetical protein